LHCESIAKSKVGCFSENGLDNEEVNTMSVSLANISLHHLSSSEAITNKTAENDVTYFSLKMFMAAR